MGEVSEKWNELYVTAIFKKGKKEDLGSEVGQPHLYPRERIEIIILETFPKILRTKRLLGIVSIDIQWTNHV